LCTSIQYRRWDELHPVCGLDGSISIHLRPMCLPNDFTGMLRPLYDMSPGSYVPCYPYLGETEFLLRKFSSRLFVKRGRRPGTFDTFHVICLVSAKLGLP
jgi:hypothetical protein